MGREAGLSGAADMGDFNAIPRSRALTNALRRGSVTPSARPLIPGVVTFLLPEANLIGALVVFRFLYFLLPLVLGSSLFAVTELVSRRRISSNSQAVHKGT
jgi:hypothetical protein